MDDIIHVYQDYLDMEDEERNAIAIQAIDAIFAHLNQNCDEETVLKRIIDMFSVICSADAVINEEEYNLFSLLTKANVTFTQFVEVMEYGQYEELINDFFNFANSQGEKFVGEVFVLAICIFACKGTITVEEQAFIDEYFM